MHPLTHPHTHTHPNSNNTDSLAQTPEKALAYLSPQIAKWIKSHIWHVQGTGQITRKTLPLTAITALHDLCVCMCFSLRAKSSKCSLGSFCQVMASNLQTVCLHVHGCTSLLHVRRSDAAVDPGSDLLNHTHSSSERTRRGPDKELRARGHPACV